MYIALEANLEVAPEVYRNWAGVRAWAEQAFGPEAVVSDDEWPIALAPGWFHPDMLPRLAETFTPVFLGSDIAGLIFDVQHDYTRQYGLSSLNSRDEANANAQMYWERNWRRWVRTDGKPPAEEG